ncbi:MAG TPA: alpha/beta hydrolase [Granulicella sp.]
MSQSLHPQVEALLAGVLKPPATPVAPTVEGVRAGHIHLSEMLAGPGEPVFRVWNETVTTEHGRVPVRWYLPSPEATMLLVYVHGGGWATGTLDSYDTLCRALALRSGVLVMSVAYSLSPEAAQPLALQQVADIFRSARTLAADAGYTVRKLAAAGDSSGGHLIAAALDQMLAAEEKTLDATVLLYPVLDATMNSESFREFATGYQLTAERMRWFWELYLGASLDTLAGSLNDSQISPLYSQQLAWFPKTMIVTAAFDPLRDEGAALAQRLAEAGAPVEYLNVPGQIHGFMRFRGSMTDPEWGVDAVLRRIGAFLQTV